LGFFKKIAIANNLAPYFLDAYSEASLMNGDMLWVILFLGPLYLYFDFSGYTDIAIGIAKALGIQLLPNFNRPFFSENMTTFWKRFHISLSSWFNDYVFRQISFRYRKWGIYASILGLLITWTLFGVWHGAGWNFMMLGFIQATAIIYEFFTKKWRHKLFSNFPEFLRKWAGRIFTYSFFAFALVFFYSPDLKTAFNFFIRLLGTEAPTLLGPISRAPYALFIYIPVMLFLELLNNDFESVYNKLKNFWFEERKMKILLRWALYSLIIIFILIVGNKGSGFIYVNF
jgi:D-alanyl-lipoteichoic acid acyltransferase DltB (MBOAT superfamily)